MIYKLDAVTGEITETTEEKAVATLRLYGWASMNGLLRGSAVLFSRDAYFCRFKDRLVEMAPDVVQKGVPTWAS